MADVTTLTEIEDVRKSARIHEVKQIIAKI